MNKCIFLVCSEIDSNLIVSFLKENQIDFNHKILDKYNGMNNLLIGIEAPDENNINAQSAYSISAMNEIKRIIEYHSSSKFYIIPEKLINTKTKEMLNCECVHK